MKNRKIALKKFLGLTLAAGAMLGAASGAQASVVGGTLTPLITAGALPDSPGAHVDGNTAASAYSGVVSINIRYKVAGVPQSYICSGALVGKRTVISAGHCVDTDGNGHVVDIHQPGADVRVVFNSNGSFNAVMTATKVAMNPDYAGFGHCPVGVAGFCVNDDISVITLGADAPASAKIYQVAMTPVTSGTHITMAGYGTSGDGVNGYTVGPDFGTKRTGENYIDLFDGNDEQNFAGANEVYYSDFDGAGKDTFCTEFGVCTPILPNNRESGIGGGDSGGPSFVMSNGTMMLVANNTFSGTFTGQTPGTFGTYFGGVLMGSSYGFLSSAVGADVALVPEPTSIALLGMGAMMLLGARRRSKR